MKNSYSLLVNMENSTANTPWMHMKNNNYNSNFTTNRESSECTREDQTTQMRASFTLFLNSINQSIPILCLLHRLLKDCTFWINGWMRWICLIRELKQNKKAWIKKQSLKSVENMCLVRNKANLCGAVGSDRY